MGDPTFGLAVPITLVEQLVRAAERRGDRFTEAEAVLDLRLHVDAALRDPATWPTREQLARAWCWEPREVRGLLDRRAAWLTALELGDGPTAAAWARVEAELDRRSGRGRRDQVAFATAEVLVEVGASILEALDAAFRQDSAGTRPGFGQDETDERRESTGDPPGTRQDSARIPPHARPLPDDQTSRSEPPPTPRKRGEDPSLQTACRTWLSRDGQGVLPLLLRGGLLDTVTTAGIRGSMERARLLPVGTRTTHLVAALRLVAPEVASSPPPPPAPPPPRPPRLPTTPQLERAWRKLMADVDRGTDVDIDELAAMERSCRPTLVALGDGVATLAVPEEQLVEHLRTVHGELLEQLGGYLGARVVVVGPDLARRSA